MRPLLKSVASSQGGLFARHQALSAGYSRKEFEVLSGRDGPWVRVRYGVYTDRRTWERVDSAGRAQLLDRAGLLACDAGTVLSHSSAARALGLATCHADDHLIHVTRLRLHDRILTRTVAGIKHHGGQLSDDDIMEIDGMPVTNAIRTALDITSEFGYRSGLVISDAVLRSGIDKPAFEAAVDRHPHDPHVTTRRAVVADADGRAETPIETLARILVKEMGVTDVIPQYPCEFADGSTAYVDLYSPRLRHVFECDGKLKYRPQTSWRGDPRTADDVVWLEKQREDRLRGLGLGVSRIVWTDTYPEAFARVSRRLWQEIRLQNAAGLVSAEGQPA